MKKYRLAFEYTLCSLMILAAAGIAFERIKVAYEDDQTHTDQTNTDQTHTDQTHKDSAHTEIIILLSFLVGTTGIERVLSISQEQRAFDSVTKIEPILHEIGKELPAVKMNETEIKNRFNSLGSAEILMGKKQIEDAAIDLVHACSLDDQIRATAQFVVPGGLSDKYYISIAAKATEAREAGKSFAYCVVLSVNGIDEGVERREAFFGHEIRNKLKPKYLETSWPLDVVIGGDRLIIAMSGSNNEKYNYGFLIRDQKVVQVAINWYEETVWRDAKKIK